MNVNSVGFRVPPEGPNKSVAGVTHGVQKRSAVILTMRSHSQIFG